VYEADRPNRRSDGSDEIARAGYEGTELGPVRLSPHRGGPRSERELKSRRLGLGSSFVALPSRDASRRTASVEHALRVGRLLATQGVAEVILATTRTRSGLASPAAGGERPGGWSDAECERRWPRSRR